MSIMRLTQNDVSDFLSMVQMPIQHFIHQIPERGDYTEDYQCVYHEHVIRMIEERPYLWATPCLEHV